MRGRLRRIGLITLAVLAAAIPARAELWSGFYVPSPSKSVELVADDQTCIAAILQAQAEYGIPDNLLLAIGIQEAGRRVNGEVTVWPWAVNAEGTGMFFRSQDQALGWVRSQQEQGVQSIDVGCMQVNLYWHANAFASLAEAFDPLKNARYAAQFLTRLKSEDGTWWQAAGSYHSRTQEFRDRYLASLARNHKVANAEIERFSDVAVKLGRSATQTPRETLPLPTVMWSDGASPGDSFSIYSRQPLTPVLPRFEEAALTNE